MQGHVVNAAVLPDEAEATRLLESLELMAAAILGIGVPAGAGRRPVGPPVHPRFPGRPGG